MGECLIKKNSAPADFESVTAIESDVLNGKTFAKSDGELGIGTMPDNGSPSIVLPLNGSQILPVGNYNGGSVSQNIPVFSGQSVQVGKNAVTVNTANKYASGNIVIPAVQGLTRDVIKYGMYVGGVGPGTWQGYINDDPNKLFYKGTFSPGNGFAPLKFTYSSDIGHAEVIQDHLSLTAHRKNDLTGKLETVAIGFTQPIDFTKYNSIRLVTQADGFMDSRIRIYNGFTTDYIMNAGETNPSLGTEYLEIAPKYLPDNKDEEELFVYTSSSLKSLSAGYMFFILSARSSGDEDSYLNIYEVEMSTRLK